MSVANPPPATPTTPAAAGWRWLHADDDFAAAAGPDWAAGVMDRPVTDRFHAKQNRNIGRLVMTAGGQNVVVYLKRHFETLSWWQSLLDGWRPSPARAEFDRIDWARAQGVPVPRAAAAGERRAGRRRESFLAVEELAGMLALHELIPLAAGRLSKPEFHRWKRGVLAEVARLAALLHGRGAYHQDLYLCHFYAREADVAEPPINWAGRVAVIDFHRLARPPWPLGGWLRVKDAAQLLFSMHGVTGLTPRDALRLFAAYRRHAGAGRWLAAAARWKAARYLRHNVRHQQAGRAWT